MIMVALTNLLAAVVWPCTVLTLVLVFRPEIVQLIRRLKTVPTPMGKVKISKYSMAKLGTAAVVSDANNSPDPAVSQALKKVQEVFQDVDRLSAAQITMLSIMARHRPLIQGIHWDKLCDEMIEAGAATTEHEVRTLLNGLIEQKMVEAKSTPAEKMFKLTGKGEMYTGPYYSGWDRGSNPRIGKDPS